jgi:hypothetical protein
MRFVAAPAISLALLLLAPVATAQTAQPGTSIAVVVHVSTPPLLGVDGSPAPDRDRRLQALASALDAFDATDLATVPIALAPSAVMCDEAMHLRGSAPKRFLRSLRKLAQRATVLSAPFANVRLSDLRGDASTKQISSGRATIERCTGVEPSRVIYPPGLALDDDAVSAAKAAGMSAALTTVVDEPVKLKLDLLPAVVTSSGDTSAKLVARRPSRSFVVVTEADTNSAALVRDLSKDRANVSLTDVGAVERAATSVGELSLPALPPPPVSYRRALIHADGSFAHFTAFTLRDNPLTASYRDVLARARSSADMSGDFSAGRRLAEALVRQIATAARRISVGPGTITFTSRRGSVPVTVINHADYPVRLLVSVASPKLDFPDGELRPVTIQPPGDTITFAAVARSTGSFPMSVSLRSSDGSFLIGQGELTVRSTAANLPALAVTIGGFVLLIVFYVRRKKKRTAA